MGDDRRSSRESRKLVTQRVREYYAKIIKEVEADAERFFDQVMAQAGVEKAEQPHGRTTSKS